MYGFNTIQYSIKEYNIDILILDLDRKSWYQINILPTLKKIEGIFSHCIDIIVISMDKMFTPEG